MLRKKILFGTWYWIYFSNISNMKLLNVKANFQNYGVWTYVLSDDLNYIEPSVALHVVFANKTHQKIQESWSRKWNYMSKNSTWQAPIEILYLEDYYAGEFRCSYKPWQNWAHLKIILFSLVVKFLGIHEFFPTCIWINFISQRH